MWNEISDEKTLREFMERVEFFHDSCIKEMRYLSGAYVDEELSMYPVNERRTLNMIIQRQFEELCMVEMEFQGLIYLKLFPSGGIISGEIIDATMILKDGHFYWCDQGDMSYEELDSYGGTVICASKIRWRAIDGCMGQKVFFQAGRNS